MKAIEIIRLIARFVVQAGKHLVTTYRLKRTLRLADELAKVNKRKYLVLMVNGIPKVYSKQELKRLIRQRKFVKGTTIQELEKKAVAVTA